MTLKDEIDDDLSINLLFPSTYLINNMNYSSYLLDTYHFYKIIFAFAQGALRNRVVRFSIFD